MDKTNTLIFLISGYEKNEEVQNEINRIREQYEIILCSYEDVNLFHEKVTNYLLKRMEGKKYSNVHIDYSSMPRSWYCGLPIILCNNIGSKAKIFFWYSEGVYSINAAYPSAGLKGFRYFSGRPSLPIDKKRIHIIALGLDSIRSQAIVSIVDPEMLVLCYAFESNNTDLKNGIESVNRHVLSLSSLRFSFPINDFEFMRSKLTEAIKELSEIGDVIVIPDGPKPLIMAMSLVSQLNPIDGLTCLQVERNITDCQPVFVEAGKNLFGFSIELEDKP